MEYCDFCRTIYDPIDSLNCNCIVGYGNRYDINIESANPYSGEWLENVNYCPFCGRRLNKKTRYTYFCDMNKCNNCSFPICSHTTDENHRLHKEGTEMIFQYSSDGVDYYMEKEINNEN